MTLIEKLNQLLNENNLSKRQFAIKADIPYMTVVGFYEKGTENIKLSTLKKIAKFFDVSLDYIADDDILIRKPNMSDKAIKKYHLLNEDGKVKVDERIEELLEVPKYRADGEPEPTHGRGKPIPSLLRDHNENKSKNTG